MQRTTDIRVAELYAGSKITADIGLTVIVSKRLDHSGFDTLDFSELYLDFSHLNTLAVYLDHPVLSVHIYNAPVGQLFADIPGMEQPLICFVDRIRIFGKHLGGQFRQVDISSRHRTGNAQLTFLAVGDLVPVSVKKVRFEARERSADRGVVISLVKLKSHRDAQYLAEPVCVFDMGVGTVDAADALASAVDELQAALSDGELL